MERFEIKLDSWVPVTSRVASMILGRNGYDLDDLRELDFFSELIGFDNWRGLVAVRQIRVK